MKVFKADEVESRGNLKIHFECFVLVCWLYAN